MLLADVFCDVADYGHCNMADDTAIVADGIATFFLCCHFGRWKSHIMR